MYRLRDRYKYVCVNRVASSKKKFGVCSAMRSIRAQILLITDQAYKGIYIYIYVFICNANSLTEKDKSFF